MAANHGVFDFLIGNPVMIKVICSWSLPPCTPFLPVCRSTAEVLTCGRGS